MCDEQGNAIEVEPGCELVLVQAQNRDPVYLQFGKRTSHSFSYNTCITEEGTDYNAPEVTDSIAEHFRNAQTEDEDNEPAPVLHVQGSWTDNTAQVMQSCETNKQT